ncbi:MAG: hypothetical protein SO163_07780, partial [Dialister sp.]|nr:hypothetical protein [Dialister sp.]
DSSAQSPRFLNTISQQTTFYSAQDDEGGDLPSFFLRKGNGWSNVKTAKNKSVSDIGAISLTLLFFSDW